MDNLYTLCPFSDKKNDETDSCEKCLLNNLSFFYRIQNNERAVIAISKPPEIPDKFKHYKVLSIGQYCPNIPTPKKLIYIKICCLDGSEIEINWMHLITDGQTILHNTLTNNWTSIIRYPFIEEMSEEDRFHNLASLIYEDY